MTPNPMAPPPAAPQKKGMPVVLIIVIVGLGLCFVIGCLAAIAIPNFLKFQSKAKQSEVRANLKAAFSAETFYFSSNNAYSDSPDEIGFSPERGNRYLYAFSKDGELAVPGAIKKENTGVLADTSRFPDVNNDAIEKGVPNEVWDSCGIDGDSIVIVGAGNIDGDPTIDVWTISTKARMINGQNVPAGTPFNHVDDTKE